MRIYAAAGELSNAIGQSLRLKAKAGEPAMVSDSVQDNNFPVANTNLSLIGLVREGQIPPPMKPTNFELADFLESVPDRLHIRHGKDFEVTPAMLQNLESTQMSACDHLMLEIAEKHFDALSHLNVPGKKPAKNAEDKVSNGVRSDLYTSDKQGHDSKSAIWNKYGGITEDDIRALRVLDLDRIESDSVAVCSAKGRGKGAILGTAGEVAWLTFGGPLAWSSTGLQTGFDVLKSHGSAGLHSINRGGAMGAQAGEKLRTGSCAKSFDAKELPKIQALIGDLDAIDFDHLEQKADTGDPEALYRYGKTLKAMGDYRTPDNIARQDTRREDRTALRLGGEQAQNHATQLGSATAKLEDAKILIRSVDEKDRQLAIEYFESAYKADARGAKAEYGRVLIEMGSNTGDGENVFKGISLLMAAAKYGDPTAWEALRSIYDKGVSARASGEWILPPNPARVKEVDTYLANLHGSTLAAAGE